MTKEFIPYQQGLQLKELGFDEPCWAWWHIEDCDIRFCYSDQRSPIINSQETEVVGLPTYSQVFRWFREKHNKTHFINKHITDAKFSCAIIHDKYNNKNLHPDLVSINDKQGTAIIFETYEEAEQACLNKLIEIVCGII